jgi:hypothetical protein
LDRSRIPVLVHCETARKIDASLGYFSGRVVGKTPIIVIHCTGQAVCSIPVNELRVHGNVVVGEYIGGGIQDTDCSDFDGETWRIVDIKGIGCIEYTVIIEAQSIYPGSLCTQTPYRSAPAVVKMILLSMYGEEFAIMIPMDTALHD